VLTVELCSRSGLNGEELRAEQGIILTQLAYVKQLLDPSTDAASKLYRDVQNQPYILHDIPDNVEASTLEQEQ
jgi:hypothetical protein